MKKKFKGVFNWCGEIHNIYLHAASDLQAFYSMTNKLASKLKRCPYNVRSYYMRKENAYEIKEMI